MVQAGTTRKSQTCLNVFRSASLCRSVLRTASTFLFAGAALVVSQTAFGQEEAPARYAPPVHVQPAAWSVLESPAAQTPAQQPLAQQPPAPRGNVSHSREIANMAQYMRMQNQAVTSQQDAQVNAALNQLQNARSDIAQSQRQTAFPPNTARREFPRSAPAIQSRPAPLAQPLVQPLHVNPRRDVVAQPVPQRTMQTAPRKQVQQPQQRQQVQQRQVVQQRPVQQGTAVQQAAPRRGIGLQDRISQVMKKTFTRPEPVRQAPRTVAQQIPTRASMNMQRQVAQVDHTVDVREYEREREADLPMLVDQPPAKAPRRAQMPREYQYRPKRSQNDRVIVPSFVETETDLEPELQLASRQEVIGSGLRRPKMSSHSQPMSYGQPRDLSKPRDLGQSRDLGKPGDIPNRTAQQQVSVFNNASTQIGSERPQEDKEEIDRIREELENRRSGTDNELPQRTEGRKSLLDMADEDAAEEARKARSSRDADLDSLEDDDDDDLEIDEDDDIGPPVFDERGCEELRSMLMGQSIRDISLDLSPPASARRNELGSLSRSWTDQSGNVLATGTLVDLRRGYVILDSGQKLPYAKLSEADWSAIADNWLLPTVCSIGQRGSLERNWSPMTVSWHASSLCHKPLYFENVQLERYGHSRGPYMQPIHSTFHFFRSIIFLPYNRAINPPNECQYSLGFYRPGNCAPWLIDPIPFSREGIRRQAITSIGLGFIP